MKILIQKAEFEAKDFYKKDNLKAATRYRRLLGNIRKLACEIRMETLQAKKAIAELRQNRKRDL